MINVVKNFDCITQEYLESLYIESRKINDLVNYLLAHAIRDAKNGFPVSSVYVYRHDYNYGTLEAACEKIKNKGFRINYSRDLTGSAEGYVGEVQFYFHHRSLDGEI